MSHAVEDFDLHAGDDKTLRVTVLDPADAVVDISGASEIRWGLATAAGVAASLTKTKTGGAITFATDGTDGVFDVQLDAADTVGLTAGLYYHEGEITLGGDAETIVHGTVELLPTSLN